ncbi:MAG: serine/threonine-protein kinase [Isosphaeraceae bacterium]
MDLTTRTRQSATCLWGSTDFHDAIQAYREILVDSPETTWVDLGPTAEVGGYRLIRPLGGGSQAEVWEARPLVGNPQPVALRILRADLAGSSAARSAFLRSAELTRRFRERSQLPTIEAGEARGVAYQSLPLVRGASLADAIASQRDGLVVNADDQEGAWWLGRNPEDYRRMIASALVGVARSLAEAHDQGVVHRDVKPSNILLDRDQPGLAFLADFGLGTRLGQGEVKPVSSGTLMYMAPERLLGLPCDDVRCDVFALGMTLYEALTLHHPRETPVRMHRSALPTHLARSRPAPPRASCPRLSKKIEAVILRAIAPEPSDRYRGASELADDLRTASQSL